MPGCRMGTTTTTILDGATSEIYYAQLVEGKGRTLMPAVLEVVEQQGLFCALYSTGRAICCDLTSGSLEQIAADPMPG